RLPLDPAEPHAPETPRDLAADLRIDLLGYADRATRGDVLQVRGEIHAVPKDVVLAHDDVAKMDADADEQWLGHLAFPVQLFELILSAEGASGRVDDAVEGHQIGVSERFHHAAAVRRNGLIHDLVMRLEQLEAHRLAAIHLLRESLDIREHDGSEDALFGRSMAFHSR